MLSLVLIAATLTADAAPPDAAPEAASERRRPGFAVVELYTSEGCSSCPPADLLLADLTRKALEGGDAIYTLGFHVPWWDNAVWRDRFSAQAHADRQQRYGDHLGLPSLYTPQVVVNGRAAFVGSDAVKIHSAVARGLATPAGVTLTVSPTLTDGVLSVQIGASAALSDVIMNVAVVEDGLTTQVRGGENRERDLSHVAVVRAYTWLDPGATSGADPSAMSARLYPPAELTPARSRVVVWLQRRDDLVVVGAAAAPFPTTPEATAQP